MIYLDNAATSRPKPFEVLQAMNDFLNNVCANSGRSAHRLAIEAGRIVYETRESLAEIFNIKNPLQIIFTMNATESINLALLGLLKKGDHAITSGMEHNSVMRPLSFLKEQGVEISVAKCSQLGLLDPDDVKKLIKKNTKIIVINHASNVTGTIQPVKEIGRIARENDILFLLDSAQTAGAYRIDVNDMNIDLLAFTGHKSLYGPQGTGGLYIREGVHPKPLKYGGTGSRSDEEYQPEFFPDEYESGTLNLVGIAGLGAGARYVKEFGINNIRSHEQRLTKMMLEGLSSIPDVLVYGDHNENRHIGVVSFNIKGISPSEVSFFLEEDYDILCRSGLHCAPSAHKTIGTFPQGTIRFSLGIFTSDYDVIESVNAVRKIAENKEHR